VEAASTDTGRPKQTSSAKDKKASRQMTLLGMVKKNQPISQNSELDQLDSQATDVDITDGLASDMLTDLSSQSVSVDWEETQEETDTQLTDVSIS
jgi:hypothetical protein